MRRSRPYLQWGAHVAAGATAYVLAMSLHGALRALADNANPARYSIAPAETTLLGRTPAAWMQAWLGPDHPILSPLSFELWFSLFWLTPVLCAIAAAIGGRRAFYSLLALHIAVMLTADALYFLMPTRPPWMDLDVTRIIAIRTDNATAFDNNPYAALPSLHVAVPAAYTIWFARQSDPRLRVLWPPLALWVAGMAWAVMYTGEHYAFCVLLGGLWAAAVTLMLPRLEPLLASLRRPATTTLPAAPAYVVLNEAVAVHDP